MSLPQVWSVEAMTIANRASAAKPEETGKVVRLTNFESCLLLCDEIDESLDQIGKDLAECSRKLDRMPGTVSYVWLLFILPVALALIAAIAQSKGIT
jgi:hypothetical protein